MPAFRSKNSNRLHRYPRPTVAITLVAATRERVFLFSKGTNNSPATRPWKRLLSGDSRCGLIDQSWTSFHRAPSCLPDAQRGQNPNVCVNVRTLATPTQSTYPPLAFLIPNFQYGFYCRITHISLPNFFFQCESIRN